MPPEIIDERKAATALEHGSGTALAQLLAGKFEEDRMKTFQRVEQVYKQDVATIKNLKSDLSFDTSDFWHNEMQVVDNKSGRNLYDDVLDLKAMTHSERITDSNASSRDSREQVHMSVPPADRHPVDTNVLKAVTKDLEAGNPASLETALNGKMQEERVRFLQSVQKENQSDLEHHRTEIGLDIDVEGFKHHTNEMYVSREAPGGLFTKNFWTNPALMYYESLDLQTDKRTILALTDDRK